MVIRPSRVTSVTRSLTLLYTQAISNHFTAFQRNEDLSTERDSLWAARSSDLEETGMPLMRLYNDAHSWQERKCIPMCVETLTYRP